MAWNTRRMMEIWYGVPGAGAVLHTLNPRLFADQLVYIINHAEDKAIFVDLDLLPIIEAIHDRLPNLRHVIVLTSRDHMPQTNLPVLCYDDLIAEEDGDTVWEPVDERAACGICFTSGTTGNPKGVVYTHRSNVLHALISVSPDMIGLSSTDRIMPVVPLFHANGWTVAYTSPMAGTSLVLPGNNMTPEGLFEMLEHGVTITAAVPTVWLGLLQYMDAENKRFSTLQRVVIGGSSCPRAVIEKFQSVYGVQVIHAWGMTETSPLGSICTFKPEVMELDEDERLSVQETVGHPPYSIDLDIVDDEGAKLPWDGAAQGRLIARGDAIVRRYLKQDTDSVDADGWFDTGDVATMDQNGYVRITDRSKDVIKSGGEWISSIDLENAAMGHPDVAEAAAIGVPHSKWGERPVLVVVPAAGREPESAAILELVGNSVAKWQVPDAVIFREAIPHTATGKISKLELRQELAKTGFRLE
jgi:fatty-acyl-CoA synthase